MIIACTHEQSQKLRCINNFPTPDMVMEYYWAGTEHKVHMAYDKKLLREYEEVDIIPCWSIERMIEGLPHEIFVVEDEEFATGINYILHIIPGGTLSEVKYVNEDGEDVLYKTEGIELRDAIFNMIMKLDEEKWYNPTEHSAP